MEQNTVENKNDFTGSWVSSSRFIFYVSVICIVSFFFLGGCYSLYKHRYMGKPEVVVPENTLYNPKYK